jgi:predicted Zn-dependent protease with MMP-like domain
MSGWAGTAAPSLAEMEALASDAFDALPAEVRAACAGLAIRVEDWPSDEMLDDLGIEDAFELTGLYDGISLPEKRHDDVPAGPDMVWLFRRPLLEEWVDRGDVALGALVAHVLVHEIAHHLGWSDDDIARIDPWWE